MDILKMLLDSAQAGPAQQVGQRFGLDGRQTTQLLGELVPALAGGIKKNTQSTDGLNALTRALQSGNHQRYLDEPEALTDSGAVADGNGVLGHVLGSKDVSRQLAARAASSTGIDAGIIKQVLPLVATMVMGSLSKQTNGGSNLAAGDGGGVLGSLLESATSGGLDELTNLAGKFFK